MVKLTAKIISEYQEKINVEPLTAVIFKGVGRELRDLCGLTDQEAIDLLNDRNVLDILQKYE